MIHTRKLLVLPALLLAATQIAGAALIGTSFSYQGSLRVSGAAANGSFDLTFSLFNDPAAGSQIGVTWTNLNVPVSNGVFTTTVDFGAGAFDGTAYWLAIGVRSNGVGSYTAVTPRQPVTPAPYALYATASAIADGAVTSAKILDGTIATADLANDAVTSAKVLDGSILGADLANNTVTSAQLADNIDLGATNIVGALNVYR